MKFYVLLLILIFPLFARAELFGPDNYDECILKSMKGVKSDLAARAIVHSCREKFAEKAKKGSPLSSAVIQNISGRAGISSSGNFDGHIYNGNKDIVVTQITVRLTPKDGEGPARDYNENVTAPPLTAQDIYIEVKAPDGAEYSWYILAAKGYTQ